MKRAWMPLYVGDYLGDTGHLTTPQHGAYLLLMMHYWRKGELPDDDSQLAKITKLPLRTFGDYKPVLQAFFHDGWKHKRIDTELARMLRVSEKRSAAGQKGGLGSALSRMKLENPRGLRRSPQAIASICSSRAAANVDHSHSHSQNLSYTPAGEAGADKTGIAPATAGTGEKANDKPGKPAKATIAISAELAALMARKSS